MPAPISLPLPDFSGLTPQGQDTGVMGLGVSQEPQPVSQPQAGVAVSPQDTNSQLPPPDFSGIKPVGSESAEDEAEDRYGSFGQLALTAGEGAAQGVLGPLAPGIEIASGLSTPEDIRARAMTNPWTHTLSEGASFAAAALFGDDFGLPGLVGETGEVAAKLLPQVAGVKTAAELATIQASNELSKMVEGDPNQTLGSAAVNIGLSGVLGGLGGAVGSKLNPLPYLIKKRIASQTSDFITEITGEVGATIMGAAAGTPFGHPVIGGFLVERALAPVFKAAIRPFVEKVVNGPAMESTIDYLYAANEGQQSMTRQVASFFDNSLKTLSFSDVKKAYFPTQESRDDLEKTLQIAQDRDNALTIGQNVSHYLPDHTSAAAELTATASNYFNALRPQQPPSSPLDATPPVNLTAAQNMYNRQLDIAQQPLLVLQHAKTGQLLPQDVTTLQTLYPGLHNSMVNKITNQLIENPEAIKEMPYAQKQSLNLLIGGNPIDTLLKPQTMQNVIRSNSTQQPQTQGPQGRAKGSSKVGGATEATLNQLNKTTSIYQTQAQSREANRMKE